jgi:N-acetylglucosaminyldiphosphoundecaprenol N-acetyl-beta-D-mannosaminyltransferase
VGFASAVTSVADVAAPAGTVDAFSRPLYCILGLPIDAIDMAGALKRIRASAAGSTRLLVSTPNLDFLATLHEDAEFRESLLMSDLCLADGMPIVWLARLVGIPLKGRVAGSDMFDALAASEGLVPLTVFLFGGEEGVAAAACRLLNAEARGLKCLGAMCPGFGTVEDMSTDAIIDKINASAANLLVLGLSSRKAQPWLLRNYHRLNVPIRANLGATINFQAGTVKRAPASLRNSGMEWLWRIKEEPYLWRRYWKDGVFLIRLIVGSLLPLMAWASWLHFTVRDNFAISETEQDAAIILALSGLATARHVEEAIAGCRRALSHKAPIVINFAATRFIDARFLGLLLMLRKCTVAQGTPLTLTGVSAQLARLFRLHGAEYLLRS